jgi:hypothetical protein
MPRRTWSDDELTDLRALNPREAGAVAGFAQKHGRTSRAVTSKLSSLRVRGLAPDVRGRLVPRSLLTNRGRSL